jgi:threonine/homoserine/homoserine lactone efflux protein
MHQILPSMRLLGAFVAASLVLAITPGPGVIYIVSRSLRHGRRAGLASVWGIALGNFGNGIAAALGLGAIVAVSQVAFLSVKYAGAAYLVYLGMRALRGQNPTALKASAALVDTNRLVREGFLVALLNPKTAIFFAAFLPQFMSPDGAPLLQSIALAAVFVSVAMITDSVYATAAGSISAIFSPTSGTSGRGRYITGGTLIGLGAFTAVSGTRVAK